MDFGILFLGPAACVMTSCVFPTEQCQTTVICIDEEGMLLDAPWLQTAVVDKGFKVGICQKLAYLIDIQVFLIELSRMSLTKAHPDFGTEGEAALSACLSLLVQWVAPMKDENSLPWRPYR
jgi:hypothetical protein